MSKVFHPFKFESRLCKSRFPMLLDTHFSVDLPHLSESWTNMFAIHLSSKVAERFGKGVISLEAIFENIDVIDLLKEYFPSTTPAENVYAYKKAFEAAIESCCFENAEDCETFIRIQGADCIEVDGLRVQSIQVSGLISFNELPAYAKDDFDYIDDDEVHDVRFAKYISQAGNTFYYDTYEFTALSDELRKKLDNKFYAYQGESYFNAILIGEAESSDEVTLGMLIA